MIDDGEHGRKARDDISICHLVSDPNCHIVRITWSHTYQFYLAYIEHLFLRLSLFYVFHPQNPPSFLE
jgi:hypothetical protein